MPKFIEPMRRRSLQLRGIIHVGANKGEELDEYVRTGANPVLWIEAEPKTFATLKGRVASSPGHHAVNALVAGTDGEEMAFNVANLGSQSSSIFDFGLHAEYFPTVKYEDRLPMTAWTLDTIVEREGLNPESFDAMCIDVQGAELEVLNGAERVLRHVSCIETEISDLELYKGGATAKQVITFLGLRGFTLIDYLIGPANYGDAVFMKSDKIGSVGGMRTA